MRTPGATSHVAVKLADLMKVLQPDATVYIWRRQANDLHLLGQAHYATTEALKAAGNPIAVEESIPIKEND